MSAAEEGDRLFQKGEGFTKRTLTRWSPDWHEAAANFERAAGKYRQAGREYQPRLAKALLRAAAAYEELSSLNSSAKCITQAMSVLAALDDPELRTEVASLCRKAADLFQANNQADKAAQTLVKGAAFFDASHSKEALQYYKDALAVYLEEGQEALSHDTFKKAIAFAIKYQEFESAIELLKDEAKVYKKQNSANLFVCYLGIVV